MATPLHSFTCRFLAALGVFEPRGETKAHGHKPDRRQGRVGAQRLLEHEVVHESENEIIKALIPLTYGFRKVIMRVSKTTSSNYYARRQRPSWRQVFCRTGNPRRGCRSFFNSRARSKPVYYSHYLNRCKNHLCRTFSWHSDDWGRVCSICSNPLVGRRRKSSLIVGGFVEAIPRSDGRSPWKGNKPSKRWRIKLALAKVLRMWCSFHTVTVDPRAKEIVESLRLVPIQGEAITVQASGVK